MATQKKSKLGASWVRAALGRLLRRDHPRVGLWSPVAMPAHDAAHTGVAGEHQDLPRRDPGAAVDGGDGANPPFDIYAAGAKGPYLRDTDRESNERGAPPETAPIRSDIRILFTTALAVVVLMVTVYFHLTDG